MELIRARPLDQVIAEDGPLPPAQAAQLDVTEIIFTAQTSAGPQSYVLGIAAPAAHATYASHVMRVAMRTFAPLPG